MLALSDICSAVNGKFLGTITSGKVAGVCIDSRKVRKNFLFVAIKGDRFDGHDFIEQVVARGVKAIVISKNIKVPLNICVIKVKDTVRALGQIAALHKSQFKAPLIAVTGSAGKTTTKELIAQVLSSRYKVLKNYRTENNHIGVPLTLLKLRKSHQVIVVELGTNRPGDIRWLTKITRPDIAVFTNVGDSHLEGLKTRAGVFAEKFQLIKNMKAAGHVVFNIDSLYVQKIALRKTSQTKHSFGINHRAAYRATGVVRERNLRLSFLEGRRKYFLRSPAEHNVYNALAAICCGRLFKISYNNINKKINTFKFSNSRQEIIRLKSSSVIDDSYNSNPLSLQSAVDTLASLKVNGKRILVCADMLELGSKSRKLHYQSGRMIGTAAVDAVIAFGPLAKHICEGIKVSGAKKDVFYCRKFPDVLKHLKRVFRKGDAVLVKGSRGMRMERAVEFLKKQP